MEKKILAILIFILISIFIYSATMNYRIRHQAPVLLGNINIKGGENLFGSQFKNNNDKELSNSVVYLTTLDKDMTYTGTGTVIDNDTNDDKYILSVSHLAIKRMETVFKVYNNKGFIIAIAKPIYLTQELDVGKNDLMILKIIYKYIGYSDIKGLHISPVIPEQISFHSSNILGITDGDSGSPLIYHNNVIGVLSGSYNGQSNILVKGQNMLGQVDESVFNSNSSTPAFNPLNDLKLMNILHLHLHVVNHLDYSKTFMMGYPKDFPITRYATEN